jgi:hypothetical protein
MTLRGSRTGNKYIVTQSTQEFTATINLKILGALLPEMQFHTKDFSLDKKQDLASSKSMM